MTRSPRRLALAALVMLSGCTSESCGDEEARLEAVPVEAFQMATALGSTFTVQIVDACVGGGLAPCSTEQVSEIVEVSQTEALFSVEAEALASVDLVATDVGTTNVSITARFEGESAGTRTASQTFDVREPDGMRLTPSCEVLEAATPWLVPVNVITSAELALQGGGDDLFHHEVDWNGTVLVDATGFDTTEGRSPETAQLAFITPGVNQVEMMGVGPGPELYVYEFSEIDQLYTDLPTQEVTEGSFMTFAPRAYIEGRVACVSDPAEIVYASVDSGPCAFSSFDTNDVQRSNDFGNGFQLYGLSAGVCVIVAWVDGSDLEDSFEITVLENQSNNAPG